MQDVRAKASALTRTQTGFLPRVERWVTAFSGNYEGDFVAAELQSADALTAMVARPAVYVRGPIASFATASSVEQASALSAKDAFLLCLVDPPTSRDEKALLGKVRASYGVTAMEQRTGNIRRLNDAEHGLPFLLPPWDERVRSAKETGDLLRLRHLFERAPIDRAIKAAQAEILIVAQDEDGVGRGQTELDGERPHDVRIAIVDLGASRPLLRMRTRVDPSWISSAARAEHAKGLDSCALAVTLREFGSKR